MIAQIVPPQNFELVRDRIANVLRDEYVSQSGLMNTAVPNSGDYLATVVVDVELKKPIDKVEVPTVIVSLVEDTFSNKDMRSMDGNVFYAIDIYTSAKQKGSVPGDKAANLRLQKLAGLTRYILSDAIYKTLLFAPGIIGNTMVNSFQVAEMNPSDADSQAMGRMSFSVKMIENNTLLNAPPVSGVQTTQQIENTSLGYLSEENY